MIDRWNEAADLDDATFRDRYLGSDASLATAHDLRMAALGAMMARSAGDMADAGDHLNGREFAKRLLDEQYGPGEWEANSKRLDEFDQLRKWGDRNFRIPEKIMRQFGRSGGEA